MDCSPPGFSVHGDSLGKNTAVGCHALLQGICPIQGSNLCLLHWQMDSSPLSHQGSSTGWAPAGMKDLSPMKSSISTHVDMCSGEGSGNPLQCSCLENPWWAAVCGVCTESDTTEVTQEQRLHVLKGNVAPRRKKGKSPVQPQHFFFFHRRNPLCASVTTAKPRQLDMKILPLPFSKTSLMTVPKMITPQSW